MSTYLAILVLVLLALLLREFYSFAWLPARAHVAYARGRRSEAKALMARVVRAPSLFGDRARMETRFRLSWMYLADGDAARAADECRAILKLRLRPAAEANVRRRLADCLEAGGHADEANAERDRAAGLVAGGANDALTAVSRGKMLEGQRRYAEAVQAYEEALPTIPAILARQRAELKVRLSLACYNAGRPDDAVRYSEEALQGGLGHLMEMTAHGTAGLGLSALGRLDEAEKHRREALQLALRLGSEDHAADYLVQIASTHLSRGELVKASQEAERAAGLSHRARRTARLLQAECLRAWGRWDEARDAMLQAREAPGLPVPADERRSVAVIDLGLAMIEIEAGHAVSAFERVEAAAAVLNAEAKLSLWCDALRVRVLLEAGRQAEAETLLDGVLDRLPALKEDRSTQLMVIGVLARATYGMGRMERCRDLSREYLAESPDPVWRPAGLYYLGLAEAALGNAEAARESFEEAASGVDTHYAQMAKKRLAVDG